MPDIAQSGRQNVALRIDPLTTLRFAAASWVVVYHTAPTSLTGDRSHAFAGKISAVGYMGVGIFFVLSGFILALVYGRLTSLQASMTFFIARFARIYPAYLLSLIIDLPRLIIWRIQKYGELTGTALALATLLLQAMILPSFAPNVAALNPPVWSIAVEVVWYLTYPLTAAAILRVERSSTIWLLMGAFWSLAVAIPLALEQIWGPMHGAAEAQIKYGALPRFPEFAVGMLLCKLHLKGGVTGRNCGAVTGPLAVTAGLAAIAIAASNGALPYLVLHNGLLIPAYGAVIWGLANCQGVIRSIASYPILVMLGEASYAMYLLHVPLFHWISPARGEISLGGYALYFSLLIASSIAVLRWVERPCRAWIAQRGGALLRAAANSERK